MASNGLLPQAATFGAGAGVGALGASLAAAFATLSPFFAGADFFPPPDDFSLLDLDGPHDDPAVVALGVACNQMLM